MLIEILILSLLLIVAPIVVGTFFTGVDNSVAKLPFRWISGQILLWAGFQLICVPFVLTGSRFTQVVSWFNSFTIVMVVMAVIYYFAGKRKEGPNLQLAERKDKIYYVVWGISLILLAVQLLCAVFLAYEEGDDAFYVAISTTTESSDYMYKTLPYTGQSTELDVRHGLAPFPIWVAYLARMSGMPPVTVAQIALPLVLIVMSYALYYCVGKVILAGKLKSLPLFMVIVEVMILYGGYTTYSAENFLLVRSAQGKAVLAAIVIPFLFMMMYILVERLQKEEKINIRFWVLLVLVQTAGCLCSTLGSVLTCMLVAIVGLCVLVCYKKWKMLIPMAVSCIPPVCYAALYFLMG